jgi:hypothetical protein
VRCEYVWRSTSQWINFPWSDKEPVSLGKAGTGRADA